MYVCMYGHGDDLNFTIAADKLGLEVIIREVTSKYARDSLLWQQAEENSL